MCHQQVSKISRRARLMAGSFWHYLVPSLEGTFVWWEDFITERNFVLIFRALHTYIVYLFCLMVFPRQKEQLKDELIFLGRKTCPLHHGEGNLQSKESFHGTYKYNMDTSITLKENRAVCKVLMKPRYSHTRVMCSTTHHDCIVYINHFYFFFIRNLL